MALLGHNELTICEEMQKYNQTVILTGPAVKDFSVAISYQVAKSNVHS